MVVFDCVREIDGVVVDDILDLIMYNKYIYVNSICIDILLVINCCGVSGL